MSSPISSVTTSSIQVENQPSAGLSASSIGLITGISAGVLVAMGIAFVVFIRIVRRRRTVFKNIASPLIANEEQLDSYIQTALLTMRTENLTRTQMTAKLQNMTDIDFAAS